MGDEDAEHEAAALEIADGVAEGCPGLVEYALLGPLEVRRDGRPVALSAGMLRRLLALLLHQPNQPVSMDQLIDALWDGAPGPNARKTLHVYVRRLRQAIGRDLARGAIFDAGSSPPPTRPHTLRASRCTTAYDGPVPWSAALS